MATSQSKSPKDENAKLLEEIAKLKAKEAKLEALEKELKAKEVKEMEANPSLKLKTGYVVNPKEKGHYHAILEQVNISPSGKRLSKPYVQIFSVDDWKSFVKCKGSLGYTVEVIHDPTSMDDDMQ